MDFNMLCDQGQQRGVFILTKNDHFQVFFSGLGPFRLDFGQFKE